MADSLLGNMFPAMLSPLNTNKQNASPEDRVLELLGAQPEPEFDALVELASVFCRAPIATICLFDSNHHWFKARVGLDVLEASFETMLFNLTIQQDDLFLVEDASKDDRCRAYLPIAETTGALFYAGMPIRIFDGFIVGALCVADRVPRTLTIQQRHALKLLASQTERQIIWHAERRRLQKALQENDALVRSLEAHVKEITEANQRLEQLAQTDPLTGLLNRREFDHFLDVEWRRATRTDRTLSVLMIDTDCFKDYNDRYGHLVGDHCLKRVAMAIADSVQRPGDIVARYGGEEFVVLLPNTDTRGAEAVAKRICAAVQGLGIEHLGSAHQVVTVSIGHSTLQASDELHHAMLTHTADLALYEAKRSGRNCATTVLGSEVIDA